MITENNDLVAGKRARGAMTPDKPATLDSLQEFLAKLDNKNILTLLLNLLMWRARENLCLRTSKSEHYH